MRFLSLSLLVAFAGLMGVAVPSAAAAQARTFKVDSSASQAQFVSDAPLEKFTGTSRKVSGEISVDPNRAAQAKGNIKVEVASIKTGIDLRDEHLRRDNWLDATRYPNIEFAVSKVAGVEKLKAGEAVDATVSGKLTMHGVAKDVTAKVKVRWTPAEAGKGDALHITGSFTIKLEDHKVSIPSIVALKVAPEILVNLDIHAATN
jgi:polyisoprenoid-binding protein YceI